MKTAKTYRLSAQALEHLAKIVQLTGTNETAIIELALAQFSQSLQGRGQVDIPEPPPNFPDFSEDEFSHFQKNQTSIKPERDSRKRHKKKH